MSQILPPPILRSRPRVLAGWRVGVFLYLLLGGVLLTLPTLAALAIFTFLGDRPVLIAISAVLLFSDIVLLIFAIVAAVSMVRDRAKAIWLSKMYCVGKIAFVSVALGTAHFVFHSWSFTSPPEAAISICFATVVLAYLVISRESREIGAQQ